MTLTSTANADILIVDDTPANLNVLSAILGKRGYRVRPAINGALALKAAQKAAPDLILLDVQMPGMDGYEVCRQLKGDSLTRDIPVVFISALDDVLDKVEAFQLGAVDYITKPFQIEEVLARVENQLVLHRQREAIAGLSARNQQLLALATQELRPRLDQITEWAAALTGGDAALAGKIGASAREMRAALDELLGDMNERSP
ncbi:MAG TPA: response regulator [Roseiflexaceae bacterium]|nr:response regulator [Roseiflexaceae bacterium]